MELRNRFVRSATYDGCADNGYVTEDQLNLYKTLSEGGVDFFHVNFLVEVMKA